MLVSVLRAVNESLKGIITFLNGASGLDFNNRWDEHDKNGDYKLSLKPSELEDFCFY